MRRTLTQACRLCGVFQFAVPAFESVFGRMANGQQPFRGVGRLCLLFSGSLEPHTDKCNDSRLFCMYSCNKWCSSSLWMGANLKSMHKHHKKELLEYE